MSIKIPSAQEVRAYLAGLNLAQIQALADSSGTPYTTILKIRNGETGNPGIETVAKFYPPKAKAKQTAKA